MMRDEVQFALVYAGHVSGEQVVRIPYCTIPYCTQTLYWAAHAHSTLGTEAKSMGM